MTDTNVINVTRGQQLLFVQREIRKIQADPHLSKTTEFIVDESDISKFIMLIKPAEGLYAGLTISFELTVPVGYPAPGHPINAKCMDSIYHPNIFTGGKLCLKYDGVGNLDSGFKETLENLVVAINYLFMHPENYGYGADMPENMRETIKKNVDAYRLRKRVDKVPKDQSARLYRSNEIYDEKVNHTLTAIKDWNTYLPKSCLKENKKSRYYMFTLGGRKIMDIATLEDVISQIIRDPRYRFDLAPSLAFAKSGVDHAVIMTPSTPFSVVMSKFKRIVYPDNLVWDQFNNCFIANVGFDKFLTDAMGYNVPKNYVNIMCNIVIRSNYKFVFTCSDRKNPHYPVVQSSGVEVKGRTEHIMTIDQYINTMTIQDYRLTIDAPDNKGSDDIYDTVENSIDPSYPVWFYISYSLLTVGEDIGRMFTNIAYRLNPHDRESPYVTHNSPPSSSAGDAREVRTDNRCRLLTEDELKLVSGKRDEPGPADKMDDYFDIELASKYLASTAEQTGLDLSAIRYLN
ncbi:hypothetical protein YASMINEVIRUS_69 [Yasminevirus sp. GU-2018]|uniref:E2 ubiquitin-conjugating enzyme n=1 Tax=Yasminevirus sp. GU-2018 TaxID=2420051 RepID=A0A5K0U902_9VIRU|nr:hypothetical protein YASMINEVIRUS_69 [Yasminevirus sp. GU-2018]